jgi:PAS domain S-box-containing protein
MLDELKERNLQYTNLANSGMALIWIAGPDKLCNYFNEPWLKFTGRTLEQEMGNGWAEGVHPDDFDRCVATYETAFDKREAFRMEYRLKHVSGVYKWLLDMGTPNYDSNGVFVGYIGHCFDIDDQKVIENKLSIEQSKLDAAFENSSMGFVISNSEGGDLRMNETALRFHDFASTDEMLKKVEDYENDWVLNYPDGRLLEYDEWPLVRATRGDFVRDMEIHYSNSKTHRKWICNLTSSAVRDNSGKILFIVQTLLDITDRKQGENQLKESEEKFRKAFMTIPDCVNINRFEDGMYVSLNHGFTVVLGYTAEDILGKTSLEKSIWVDVNERKRWAEELNKEGEVKNFTARFRAKDGKIIHATVASSMIEVEGVKYVFSITRDITEIKETAEKLKIREGELDTLVNLLPDLVWLKDENGVYLNCNNRFELFFGVPKEEIIGKTDYEFLDKEVADFFRKHDKNAIKADKPTKNEEWVQFASDGHREFLETVKTPMRNNSGQLLGVLGIGRDLTNRYETEEKLRRSESLFKTVFETSPDVMTITRMRDSVYVNVNDSFTNVLGYTADEVLGFSAIKKNIWYDAAERQLLVDILMRDGAAFNQEFRFLTKNNELVYGLMSAKIIQIDGENHLLGITRPINDLKAAQDAMKESEEKFRNIFENSVVGKSITGIDGSMSVNRAFCEILGYTEEELKLLSWKDITHPDDVEFKEKETKYLLEGTKNETKFLSRFIHKTGKIVWADISSILQRDKNGDPLYFITVVNDVTEKKLADEKVELSEKRFRALVENVQDMVSIFNAEGKIVYTSPAVERITGFTLEDIQQMTYPEFIHPDEMAFRNKLKQTCSDSPGVPIYNESRLLHKDGHTIWVEGSVTNLLQDDSVSGIVTNYRDITDRKIAEEKLYENNDLLCKLTAQVPGVVYQYRLYPDGHSAFPYSSSGMYDIYEVTSDEVRTDASLVFTRLHPDDIDMIVRTINESAQNQTYYQSEYRVILPKQGLRWRRCEAKPELLEDGSTLWYGIITDITDRKVAEQILQESEDRYRSLFQRNSSVMLILNPETGNVVDANPAACSYYGWEYSEICTKNIADINMLSSNEIQKVLSQTKNEQQNHLYLNHRLASGEIRDVEVYATPIKYGESVMLYSIIHDITDRKKAEKELRESQEKLSTLFSSMTEMVAIHQLEYNEQHEVIDYRIVDCNSSFSDMIRIEKENLVGRLATEIYRMEKAPFLDIYSEVAINGKSYEHDFYYEPMDKYFIVSVVSTGKDLFSTIITDITTIKQFQEEIVLKNKELENYLYVASHDLRSPLVNIQGFSQRLKKQFNQIQETLKGLNLDTSVQTLIDEITNEAVPKTLYFILSNVTKMDNLINSLLQISRTGRLAMVVKQLDMNQLLNTIVAAHNFQITELSARVSLHQLADCYGDENQLNQLFSNIIDNAIKYRDNNRILEIDIKSHVRGKKVVYSVADNGRGINARHMEKIWDIFFRADPASSEIGDGIGLSIAKTIAVKHKGRVWVESEESKGSTFYIELQQNDFSE